LRNYRSRLDIIADILGVVSGEARKTQIMYRANLSYAVMQKYLAEITEASLISFEGDRLCYSLTDKGRDFLRTYQEYSKTNKHAEKQLKEAHIRKDVLNRLCSGA
jgi:predicted transcriptional regulator